nr:transposase (putative), gypsy type [Tanacetum cinerariifolium]
MSFSKRSDNASVCYTKLLDSLKHWNDHFFWVDAYVFPFAVPWHNNKTLRKDPHPTPTEFNADVCNYLADNLAPCRKFSEPFLCFVGISWYYDLDVNYYPTFWTDDDEEMDLFAFINHADPTKVRIGEREVGEGEVSLLQLTKADSASGSNHPPNKLWDDHGTSGHVGASIGGKSLAAIQELFEKSILNVEVGVTAAATVPFVTSSMTPTLERRDGGPIDSVSMMKSLLLPSLMCHRLLNDCGHCYHRYYWCYFRYDLWGIAGPSQPAGVETSLDTFFVSQDLDSETLQQIYACFSSEVRLRSEHNYTERKKFERRCARLTGLLREKDDDVANLKAHLSLKEAKAAKAIRLCSQISTVEAVEAAQSSELDGLKELNAALEGRVA